MESRTRDLAMFNFAIDSKLKGCNVVSLKIEDVAPNGITVDRQNWTQFSRTVGVASSRGDDLLAAGQLRGQTLWRLQPRLRLRADGNLYQGGGIVVGLSYV
jgi:hypothetical protein